jgi:hypothetical protein
MQGMCKARGVCRTGMSCGTLGKSLRKHLSQTAQVFPCHDFLPLVLPGSEKKAPILESASKQSHSRHQWGILQFNPVVTPATWRQCQIPQVQCSVPKTLPLNSGANRKPLDVAGASDQP